MFRLRSVNETIRISSGRRRRASDGPNERRQRHSFCDIQIVWTTDQSRGVNRRTLVFYSTRAVVHTEPVALTARPLTDCVCRGSAYDSELINQ